MRYDTAGSKIRIMLVEDHVLVRRGLVSATEAEPDLEVVAEVEDGRQVVESFRRHSPDVVVVNFRMSGADGIEIMGALRREFGTVRILMLSFGGGDDITRSVQEGASGYLMRGMELKHLLQGIRAIHGGGQYFPCETPVATTQRIGMAQVPASAGNCQSTRDLSCEA